jgi:CHAT domain-containing protein
MNCNKLIGLIVTTFIFWYFFPEKTSYSSPKNSVQSTITPIQQVQSLYNQYQLLLESEPEKATSYLTKGIILLKKSNRDSIENTLLIEMYQSLYNDLYIEEDDIDTVLFTALEVYNLPKIQNSKSSVFAKLCSDIAVMYSTIGDKMKAIEFYQKSINEQQKSIAKSYNVLGLSYNNLAFAYDEIGHTHQVLKNYEKAHQVWYQYCNNYVDYNSTVLQNMIVNYISYGDIKSATKYLKIFNSYFSKTINPQNLAIEKLAKNDSISSATYSYLKANIDWNISQNNLDTAQSFIHTMQLLYAASNIKQQTAQARYLFTCIESLGMHYKSVGKFKESESTYHKTQPYINDEFFKMKFHANLGILFYDEKDFKKSLLEINQALQYFSPSTKSISFFMLSTLKSELLMHLNQEKESIDLLNFLYSRMLEIPLERIQLQQISYKNFNDLNTIRHISLLLKSALIYELKNDKQASKNDIKTAANFYKVAAEMFHQYYLKGFYNKDLDEYAEQINEGLLSTNLLLNKPFEIKYILNTIENNESQHLWKKFIDRQSETIKDSKNSFSSFSQLDFDIVNFQKNLKKNEVIIKYIVGVKNVYSFIIDQKNIDLKKLESSKELTLKSKNYYQQIIQFDNGFSQSAKDLHQLLILPLNLKNVEKVTFIMDDFLHILPMEAILEPQEFQQISSIGYAYSLKLLEIQSNIQTRNHDKKLAVFAPTYISNIPNDKRQFNQLNFTQKEADAIIQSTKGKLFQGKDATKNNFIQVSSQYNILHLAMHAVMDTNNYEQSYLAFQNNQPLYFSELYDMKIQSKLAILSACNTGNGLLENGEGNMSLSRAFTYAGVPATIHSLWEVPDKQTAQLMELFYELLKDGHDPANALTMAKKVFIEKYPQNMHPFFWAGFVFNGYAEPVKEYKLIYIGALIFTFLIVIILIIGRKYHFRKFIKE